MDFLEKIQAISRRSGFEQTGDDAAVLGDVVLSTDQFVENTHFTWEQMTAEDVGYKGAVQALSDLAAMASPPQGLLVSAAWPAGGEEKILAVFRGIERACLEYKAPLLGGDITRSTALTYFDFTAVGRNERVVFKKGARPGDLVAVTGPLGSAKGGLYALDHGLDLPELIAAFRVPRAHVSTALSLKAGSHLTALTDISDSLAKSLHEISHASGTGAAIDFARIPVQKELLKLTSEKKLSLSDFVLYGGEDYQLLMTLPATTSAKVISDHGLTVIGSVTSSTEITVVHQGPSGEEKRKISKAGWDPFIL